MATIKDVSRNAGVSIATVSNVLNNTKYVSDDVKKRVYTAIEKTGYIPNKIARSLKIKKTNTIGLIVNYIENPLYSGLFREIERKASAKGYSVIVCNTSDNAAAEAKQIEILLSNHVDGLIIVAAKNSEIKKRNLIPPEFPVVFVNKKVDGFDAASVVIENKKAAYEAVSHLINAHSLEQIAIVIGEKANKLSKEREQGYLTALKDHNLPFDKNLVIEGGSTFQGGVTAAEKLLASEKEPNAIFVTGTTMLLGVMLQMKKAGVKCPEDISIIGFSDTNINLLMDPPLSSVAQPIENIAENALDSILKQVEDGVFDKETTILPCTINYRRSCGCYWDPAVEMLEQANALTF